MGHEGFGIEPVKILKPGSDVRDHRLKQHTFSDSPDTHLVPLKTKFARQPYRLTAAIAK